MTFIKMQILDLITTLNDIFYGFEKLSCFFLFLKWEFSVSIVFVYGIIVNGHGY